MNVLHNRMRVGGVLVALTAFAFLLASVGCKPRYRRIDKPAESPLPDQESIYQSNQFLIRQNALLIRESAASRGWTLTETGTGVFYQVLKSPASGRKRKIEAGDRLRLSFTVSLLDGTECYSSQKQGLKEFIVEKSEAESGLHEVVQFLSSGDSARVILPPHRAYGLTGDGNLIPPMAILVYEFRIDSVTRHLKN